MTTPLKAYNIRMRIWGKLFKENHLIKDITIEDYSYETRTHKIFNALDKMCLEFDLQRPIWLESNIKDFKRNSKTRFRKESFIEDVPFDYLEFHVIEED